MTLGVSDRVRFLGHCRDVREVLYAADAFVMPSLCEGFGNAAVEAMATGLPVVLSEAMSHFRPIGSVVIWVAPDAGALARGIGFIRQMPLEQRRDIGAILATAVAERYGRQQGVRQYARLYRDLAGRAHRHNLDCQEAATQGESA